MLFNTFLNDTAGCRIVLFGFSEGSINLNSSHDSIWDSFDSWNVHDSIVGHTYERDSLSSNMFIYFWDAFLIPGIMQDRLQQFIHTIQTMSHTD